MSEFKGFPLHKWRTCQLAMLQHDLKPRTFLVLFRLIEHHNHKTGLCFPSEELLAVALNCTTRTIRTSLRELESVGLIKTRKGLECPPRNYYELKFFAGSNEEYRKAEKNCLHRRKKSSGKPENEPKKYAQRKKRVQYRSQLVAKGYDLHTATTANKRGQFEGILAERMGGGDVGWAHVMGLDEAIIEDAIARADGSTKSLFDASDELLRRLRSFD